MTKIWNQIAQRLSDLGAQMLDSVVFGIIVDEVSRAHEQSYFVRLEEECS